MKNIRLLLLVTGLLTGYSAWAQLSGPTNVYTGINYTYTYTGFVVLPTWQVSSNATIVSTMTTGTGYQATIRWNSGTTGWVTFKDKTIPLGTINTTISCIGLPAPVNGTREEPGVVTLNSTIGQNGTNNRWYSALTGGTLLSTSQGYSPNVSGTTTFYVASFNASCESSPRQAVTAHVTPKPVVQSTLPNLNMGSTATLSVSNNTYTTYSWRRNGVVIGTSSTVAVNQPGTYTVVVTKTNMTGSGTSAPLVLERAIDAQPARNMIIVNNVLQDGITTEANVELLEMGMRNRSISYIGGLGNSLQTIVSQGSPLKKDIIYPVAYDVHGRQLTTYLPYISAADDSKFRQNALNNGGYTGSEQYGFYQQTGQKRETDTKPYSVTELEPSPLARTKAQTGPGNTWHTAGKKNAVDYMLNRATDNIRLWKVNSSGMPVSTVAYANYQLQIVIATDENGHKVRIYTDKLGRTVQKDVEKTSGTWLRTCYIYNDLGQLTFVLSPEGVVKLTNFTPNSSFLDQWAFRYKYDDLGRLIEYKAPGAGWLYTVYDKLDRPVMTQDANLRSTNSWTFIKYDMNGRVVLTGIKVIASSTRASVQSSVNSQAHMFELPLNSATGFTLNRTYPTVAESELLTVAYYDNYDFLAYTGWDAESHNFSMVQELGHTGYATRVTGLPTGGKVRLVGIGTTTWLNAVQYYDHRYRPIQMLVENQLNGLDRTTIKYNTLKQAVETRTSHNGVGTVTVVRKFTYDHAGRMVKIHQNINSAPSDQLVAEYEYNELGQLVDKKLHNLGGTSFLQSVDFRYTIRGWIKSINNAQLNVNTANNDEDNDYFGMELLYEASEGGLGNTQLYNGAISAVKYKGPGDGSGAADQQSYKYTYDRANRLLTATSQTHTGSAWTGEAGSQNENMTYDDNGNIKTLLRNHRKHQLIGITASYVAEQIDNLTYTYASGNRLTKVEDASGRPEGFTNGVNVTTEYTYNNDGNLTADLNKGVSSITYNKLGKPETINFTDGRRIEYTYTATGTKVTMKNYQGIPLEKTTDYVGGFVYENGALKFFGSPEGRVVKNGSTFEYQYAIADHQGNTRVVFTAAAPATQSSTANMEASSNSEFHGYPTGAYRNSMPMFNHTPGGTHSQLLRGNSASQVGVAKSYKVYPGDKVKIEAWGKYHNPTGTGSDLAGFASALLSVFGLPVPSPGETGTASYALNTWGALVVSGNGGTSTGPKAFVNIIVFDKNFNFLDAAWDPVDPAAQQVGATPVIAHDYMMREYTAREEGYVFMYVSNENPTLVDVYFDDVVMTYTPTNLIQYNEYYPFGLQASTSWTRENSSNNFLYNEGSELNYTSGWYETMFRSYDPVLGRFHQVDPLAYATSGLTPYHYGGNNPIMFNDPWGLLMNPGFSAALWNVISTLWNNTPDDGIGSWTNSSDGRGGGTYSYYSRGPGGYYEIGGAGSAFTGTGTPGSANSDVAIILSNIAQSIESNNTWQYTAHGSFEGYAQQVAPMLGMTLLREVIHLETLLNPAWLHDRLNEYFGFASRTAQQGGPGDPPCPYCPGGNLWNSASNYMTGIGMTVDGASYRLGSALEKRLAYSPRNSNFGQWMPKTLPPGPTRIGGFNVPTGLVKGAANTLKVGGAVLGGVGFIMTGAEIYSGQKSLIGEGGLDLIMGGVAFIPGGGWIASGLYFGGKWALEATGNDFWNK